MSYKIFILIQFLFFSINLNANSPLIKSISHYYGLKDFEIFFYIGGLNNLLIFLPMAFSSLAFAYFKFKSNLSVLSFVIGVSNFLIASRLPLEIFYISNLLIGCCIGIAIPSLYKLSRIIEFESKTIYLVILANISIGVGLLLGQYLTSAIIDLNAMNWNYAYYFLAFLFFLNTVFLIGINLEKKITFGSKLNELPIKLTAIFQEHQKYKKSLFYLSQYIPGSIPWGAFSVFIFPFLQELDRFDNMAIANLVTILSIGMVVGSILAGKIQRSNIGNSEIKILYLILFAFLLSIACVYLFVYFVAFVSFQNLLLLMFGMGVVFAFPGTYIKGLLFLNHTPEEAETIFAIENFLESLGKGIGPIVIGLLIILLNGYQSAFLVGSLFWLICLVPILILIKNRRLFL